MDQHSDSSNPAPPSNRRCSPRLTFLRILAAVLIVLVFALHYDFWNWGEPERLFFGWMPPDIAYHVFWLLVSIPVLHLTLSVTWRAK